MGILEYWRAKGKEKSDVSSDGGTPDDTLPVSGHDGKHVSAADVLGPPAQFIDRSTQRSSTQPSEDGQPNIMSSDGIGLQAKSIPASLRHLWMEEIKHEVMVNYLFQHQCSALWVEDGTGREGIVIRKSKGYYMACPPQLLESSFAAACATLNLQAAMTVNSRIIKTFFNWSSDAVDVPLRDGLHIQILPTMDDLSRARRHQFAAFIASEALLVVWDDDAMNLIPRARAIERELMERVWKGGQPLSDAQGTNKSKTAMTADYEKNEETGQYREHRPTNLINAFNVSLSLLLVTLMLGLGLRAIIIEIMIDGSFWRIAFIAMSPVQIFFTLFFSQVIVGCLVQIIGPVKQMKENSKYYSGLLPRRLTCDHLPHVTIQCPVYKESLDTVIAPTIKSVKQAMSTYEMQGGSANLLIHDDGLQVIGAEERQARIEFYHDHIIGWTARPRDNSDGFIRKGKFKKASNMNYGLALSSKVEDKLEEVQRSASWTQIDEAQEYDQCLRAVIEEDGRAWADGNIRIGDYILIIDSDTRMPVDCLLDAVSEMEQCPEVGILQFSSGVMQVVYTYFENGIAFFTNLIYTAIKYGVSNGDIAPFVGHNAILRWSAVQHVAFSDEDGIEKFWSESHVSEDFDIALRMQVSGFIVRVAAWAGEGFKEGVSLTVYDELARWEKYAFGCNELLFHPIRFWPIRGPFTPLFKRFILSSMPFTSKITITAYIGTYYAIGAAWIMTTTNYLAVGWFNGYLDKYYIDSWKVLFSIIIVFNLCGNIALAIMRYRTSAKSLVGSVVENFKWTFMLCIFFGGLSLHVSQALLAHMFEIDMTWGATAKEAEFSNFFIEVPRVLRRFKFSICFSVGVLVAIVILAKAEFVPYDWRIEEFVAIFPMALVATFHLLLPIALNPALMVFSW